MSRHKKQLFIDIGVVSIGILFAVFLAKTGKVEIMLDSFRINAILASLVGGLFFTSMFTAPTATVILGELAQEMRQPLYMLAILGGIGAMIGDFIIFSFVRDRLSEDFHYLAHKSHIEKFRRAFRTQAFRWTAVIIGSLIVASPLPDEIGLAIMGVSKIKRSSFLLISFILNSVGIFVIGWIAQTF